MAAITRRDADNVMRTLFRRCAECAQERPSCTDLGCEAKGAVCVQTPPSCDACATVSCQKGPVIDPPALSSKPNVGAIAGGVVSGVVGVAIIVFIVWKFCLKGKRRKFVEEDWQEAEMADREKPQADVSSRRSARASTHTVASMASSVLTRASNIIQIAYIPGVTNRSGPQSPDMLVPPVPPIPAMSPSTGLSSPYADSEQHFFVPDFRDSMASSTADGRSSFARTSLAPSLARESVASTVYRQNAIVSPLPAQTIVRGKAAVVSVKTNGSNSPTESTMPDMPPVPRVDSRHQAKPLRIQMPGMGNASTISPQNSVRSTAQLGKVRALNITKKKSNDLLSSSSSITTTADTIVPPRPLTEVSVGSSDDGVAHARARQAAAAGAEIDSESDSDSDDEHHARARRSLLRDSAVTEINDSPLALQSPFSDRSSIDSFQHPRPLDGPHRQIAASVSSPLRAPMSPIVEEISKAVAGAASGASGRRARSPFGDDQTSDLR